MSEEQAMTTDDVVVFALGLFTLGLFSGVALTLLVVVWFKLRELGRRLP